MRESDRQMMRRALEKQSSEVLLAACEEHDESKWRAEAFDMIRVILLSRGISTQVRKPVPPSESSSGVEEPEGDDCEWQLPECTLNLDETEPLELVTVFKAGSMTMIPLVKSLLLDAQIPYIARGEHLQGVLALGMVSTGFNPIFGLVQFQVRSEDAEFAREVLQSVDSPEGEPGLVRGQEEHLAVEGTALGDESDKPESPVPAAELEEALTCAECRTPIRRGSAISTGQAVFCQSCYLRLANEVGEIVGAQHYGINYGRAIMGGLLGGALGALAWWGFTIMTHVAFGLVAVLIGLAVGKGVVIFAGHKRSVSLQMISVVISIVSFVWANYWVNRSIIIEAYSKQGEMTLLPLLPDPHLLFEVARVGFGLLDVVFLAVVVWEAWRIPRPIRLVKGL